MRNAIAHNGGRATQEVANNYARFSMVANAGTLGLKEVPAHGPLSLGDQIRLQWRGMTGLGQVILRIITTYDIEFGESLVAEKEVVRRLKAVPIKRGIFPGSDRPAKRKNRILAPFVEANLPPTNLSAEAESWLKKQGIIPNYA
jgi:hypothetical protein